MPLTKQRKERAQVIHGNNHSEVLHTRNGSFFGSKVAGFSDMYFIKAAVKTWRSSVVVVNLANTVLNCLCYLVIWNTREVP